MKNKRETLLRVERMITILGVNDLILKSSIDFGGSVGRYTNWPEDLLLIV